MNLRDVVAVVTGGASGLGEATVRRILAAGGKAAILDRPKSNGAALAKELGEAARFFVADVTDGAAVETALDESVAAFGKVNVAVNCAGVGTAGRVLDKNGTPHSLELFTMTIQVNLIGTFNVIRVAAARMARNEPNADGERGVIVNTASVAAFDGQIGQVAYSASKGGVVGMTLPVARDLASIGVRCLTIAPGTFDTPMLAMGGEDLKNRLAAGIPFPKRLGKPEEFGLLVTQIVENAYLNGEVIRLDGSLRMAPR
jgi:3-hydroxyacyl-CoA dehydrogenase / 3-hydroxy-2-methylbutyryl-CoA dehydrogenase